jgi:hypothetical protein
VVGAEGLGVLALHVGQGDDRALSRGQVAPHVQVGHAEAGRPRLAARAPRPDDADPVARHTVLSFLALAGIVRLWDLAVGAILYNVRRGPAAGGPNVPLRSA